MCLYIYTQFSLCCVFVLPVLQSRLSAIKLRGGSVAKAKNPPKGAKHAFVVTAPDPANRRK